MIINLLATIGLIFVICIVFIIMFEVSDHAKRIKVLEDRSLREYAMYLEFEKWLEGEKERKKNEIHKKTDCD